VSHWMIVMTKVRDSRDDLKAWLDYVMTLNNIITLGSYDNMSS